MRILDFSRLKGALSLQNELIDHWMLVGEVPKKSTFFDGICSMGLLTTLFGELKININQSSYNLGADSFLVINRGSLLKASAIGDSKPVLLLFKHKTAQLAAAELFHKKPESNLSFDALSDHQLVEHIHYINASLQDRLELLLTLGDSCASFQQLKSDSIVRSLIEELSARNYEAIQYSAKLPVKKETTRSELYIRLSMARDWLAKSFKKPLDIDAAAAVAMMSTAHFSRHFKKAYGIPPYQYLMEIRMEWAKDRILNSKDSMQQIANEICFETLSSFSYQFKKWSGLSPRSLRQTH